MALFKALVIATLLLFLLVVDAAHTKLERKHTLTRNDAGGYPSPDQKIYCRGACGRRCRLSSRPNLCKRACGSCCSKCNCVPPGTYGNKEQCPCYASLTTRGNKPKCP